VPDDCGRIVGRIEQRRTGLRRENFVPDDPMIFSLPIALKYDFGKILC
jgi:hypothetical protein